MVRRETLNLLYQTGTLSGNPLAMTAVLYVVFSNIEQFRSKDHFALFILAGLIHFNFFTNAVTRAAAGLLASRHFVLNTTVPTQLIVFRQVCLEGFTFVIEVILLLLLSVFFGSGLGAAALYYPLVFAGLFMLTFGTALMMCSLVVFLTDLTYIWGVVTRMLFFLTPIFYSPDMLDHPLVNRVIALNPLAQIVQMTRNCVLYRTPITATEAVSVIVGPAVVLLLGWQMFRVFKRRIPDFI